jgi:DNA repair exonuclease SbcCD ATPase subunit
MFLPLSIAAQSGHYEVVKIFVEEEEERRRSKKIGCIAVMSAQDRAAARASARKESRSLADDLAARDSQLLELEATLAREIKNNADLAKHLVSIERRAQTAEAMVHPLEEWRRLAVKQLEEAERKADEAVEEQRLAVMWAGEAQLQARAAERRTGEMQISAKRKLQEAQKKCREAETKARRLERKLGTESKLSAELETKCERFAVRMESAEGKVLRIKVEAGEDVNDARSDASAARTGAIHSKVKLETQATQHESGQTMLRDKVEELKDGLTCVICMMNPKNLCLFPGLLPRLHV